MREVRELPADCRAFIPTAMRGTVQSWQSYVWLEHCDRVKRLRRMSVLLPPEEQPRFYEGVVPASRLPAEYATDVPVLRVVFPERTFFDTADATLRPEAEQVAAIVAESLRREPPDVALFVAGHADARGERMFNEGLSIDRADAIARAVLIKGVAASSIWRVGFGEDMPLASGMTPYAWDRNRRVEFLFAAKPEAVGVWLADQQLDGLCQARDAAESARCRARLTFRPDYVAQELPARPRSRVDPVRPPKAQPSPFRERRPPVSPAARRLQTADARGAAPIALDPEGGRRIRIDPVNRRAPLVKLDL